MNIRSMIFGAVLSAAVAVAGAATGNAAPIQDSSPNVTYHVSLDDRTVVATLEHGAFTVAADRQSVAVRDQAGAAVASLPLTVGVDGKRYGVHTDLSVDGRTLRLTPEARVIGTAPTVQAIASNGENAAAQNDLMTALNISTSVGSLLGLAAGAVLGLVVGVGASAVACVALTVGCVVAVLPILATTAVVGGIVGTVLVGGPTLLISGYNYVSTLLAAPGTSRYADHGRAVTR